MLPRNAFRSAFAPRGIRGLSTNAAPPPPQQESLSERVLTFGHRVIASGLVLLSAGGLAFVLAGCWEIYDRNMKRKALREAEKNAS